MHVNALPAGRAHLRVDDEALAVPAPRTYRECCHPPRTRSGSAAEERQEQPLEDVDRLLEINIASSELDHEASTAEYPHRCYTMAATGREVKAMTETAASQHNEQRVTALLGIAEELVLELSLKPRRGRRDRLDLSLAQDWGFDSLSRAELLLRIEPAFATSLPSRVLHDAGTLRDVLAALGSTAAVPLPAATPGPSLTDEVGAEPAPDDAATLLISIPEAAGVTTLLRLRVDSLRGVATVSEPAVAAGPPAVGADLRLA